MSDESSDKRPFCIRFERAVELHGGIAYRNRTGTAYKSARDTARAACVVAGYSRYKTYAGIDYHADVIYLRIAAQCSRNGAHITCARQINACHNDYADVFDRSAQSAEKSADIVSACRPGFNDIYRMSVTVKLAAICFRMAETYKIAYVVREIYVAAGVDGFHELASFSDRRTGRTRAGNVAVFPLIEIVYGSCRRDHLRERYRGFGGYRRLGYRHYLVVPVLFAFVLAVFKFRDRLRAVTRDEHEIVRISRREIRRDSDGRAFHGRGYRGSLFRYIDVIVAGGIRSFIIDIRPRTVVIVNVRNVIRPFLHRLTVVVLGKNAVHRISAFQIRRTALKSIDKAVDIHRGLLIACPRLE